MNAGMKRPRSIKTVIALALLIVPALTLAAVREPVSISGTVDLVTFTGTATVIVAGEELTGSVKVVPLAEPVPKDGGLYFPDVQHVFDFADGSSLTTAGEELAMPTDENAAIWTLHGNMDITDGTGAFEGASGELRVNGQMDWSEGQATFEAHGVVSH